MEPPLALGIDLGTTNSCVAIVRRANKKLEVIQSDVGANTTPSFVSYDEEGYVSAGEAAIDQGIDFPQTTLFDIKRLIGRSFYDAHIQKYMKMWPFDLVNMDGHVGLKVWDQILAPQAVLKELISHLRNIAQDYLGGPVQSAVVTLPAYFNDLQEGLTREACVKAGLTDIHFIREPIAAAYAYGLHNSLQDRETRTCLIFDLGGGTFDVTVFTINSERKISIKGIGGDARVGGEDFTDLLSEYCLEKFNEEHGVDIKNGKLSQDESVRVRTAKRLRRLRKECEKQKCFLSVVETVVVSLFAMHEEADLVVQIKRRVFEELIQSHLASCLRIIGNILKKTELRKESIDEVIFIGGSCRIPKVREVVNEYFGGRVFRVLVDGDVAVASGAAVCAFDLFKPEGGVPGNIISVLEEDDAMDQYASVAAVLPVLPTKTVNRNGKVNPQGKGSTVSPRNVEESGRETIQNQLENLNWIRDLLTEHEFRFPEKRGEIKNWFDSLKKVLKNVAQSNTGINLLLDSPLLSELAKGFFDQDMFQQAFDLNCKIFDRIKKVLGEDHLNALQSQYYVARSLDKLNEQKGESSKKSDALELLNVVKVKCGQILGTSHRLTLKSRYYIAWIYEKHQEYTKALQIFQDIWDKQKRALGPKDKDTLSSEASVMIMWIHMGNTDKALAGFKTLLEKQKKVLGEEHRDTLVSEMAIGYCLYEKEKFRDALKILENVLEKCVKSYGRDHSYTRLAEQWIEDMKQNKKTKCSIS